jgi:hypothetical protein
MWYTDIRGADAHNYIMGEMDMKKSNINRESVQMWFFKRKLEKQMMHVLKNGYNINAKAMSKEKVNGMSWKQRLLSVYIIDMSNKDFTAFHRLVKPISRNLKFVENEWYVVLTLDGKLTGVGVGGKI